MRHCRIAVTRKSPHWFTEEEDAWVLSHVEQSRTQSGGRHTFFTKLCEKFYTKFPYRDPKSHPELIFTPQQRELAMKEEDKLKLRKRLIDKLGKRRRTMDRKARNAGGSAMSDAESSADESAPNTPESSDDDSDEVRTTVTVNEQQSELLQAEQEPIGNITRTQTITNTIENVNDIPGHSHTNSHTIPHLDTIDSRHYNSGLKEDELNDVVHKLIEMGRTCWARIGEEELRRRQAQLPILLHAILKILGQGTGAEAHITALWHDGRNVKACNASTDRSSKFTNSEQARKGCAEFSSFVSEQLGGFFARSVQASSMNVLKRNLPGSRICTTVANARPTVYGDLESQMRPILPPRSDNWLVERQILKQFFEYLWVWQGGHLPIPWDRLELDGRTKKFFLIDKARFPTGIKCLRDPDLWDENETNAWTTGLRSSGARSAESFFQFRQPRPGVVEHETRTVIHSGSSLVYQPESLLYIRRMMMEKEARESLWKGLPPVPTNPYKPLVERQLANAKTAVIGNKPLEDLLNYLSDYETYGPYQATRDDWNKAARECGYIKSELPSPTSGMEYLVRTTNKNGAQLPPEFFDSAHAMHNRRNLSACMRLIRNNTFIHARTGTYMGGPCGFKWVVLLLAYLFSCSVKLRKGLGPMSDGVYAEWPRRGDAELEKAIEHVQETLTKSVKILHEMNEHRAQDMATGSGEVQQGIGEWSERDIMEYVTDPQPDEWTQRNLIVTSDMERQQTSPKAPQSASSPQKRPSTQFAEDDDDDILMEDEDEPSTPQETPRKKSKYNSSDSDDDGVTYLYIAEKRK
ncbi:hypothetical protein FRC09_019388 [Ceratobasidium sp. 395]|nr:hypothetical protein FRC09_019388 [Ceratobasidium sp. 395]